MVRNLKIRSSGLNMQMRGFPQGEEGTDAKEAMIK